MKNADKNKSVAFIILFIILFSVYEQYHTRRYMTWMYIGTAVI